MEHRRFRGFGTFQSFHPLLFDRLFEEYGLDIFFVFVFQNLYPIYC